MRRDWSAVLSIAWLMIILLVGFSAPAIAKEDPSRPVNEPLSRPGEHPPMGTDALGRDLWSRMLYGSRLSPGASLAATLITLMIGGLVGLIAASLGGWVDRILMGLANAALAVPGFLLAMIMVGGMGPGLSTVILAVGLGGAPGFARLTRTMFKQIRERGYVMAAEALGAGRLWIAVHHLIPNLQGQLLSLTTTQYAWAFMGTTTLTFLGLAGNPSIPEWGVMLNSGRSHIVDAPWLALWPGLAISFTILAVHNLGNTLTKRDAD